MPCTFSSTSVYFISLLLLGAIITPPTVHTQEDTPHYFLDAHNSARAKVGVGPMTWNETLATYASTRVADCTCEYSGGPYGENLIANSRNGSSSISGTYIMNIWVAEKANYDSRSNACVAGRSCRNYTQVVWQNSRSLGCAKVQCSSGGYFFSCNYDPPGNLIGQRPFEINESDPTPEPSPAQPPNVDFVPEDRRKAIGLVAGLIAGASALILLGLVSVWFVLRWKRKQKETTNPVFDVSFGNEFENGTGPRKFSYGELATATNNFCEEAKLGEGGFGGVYKGFLKDLNTFVAVKRIVDHAKGSQTTALAGTIGYMAPECLTASKASKESDVFSFGIVLLEIACGRRSIEQRCDESQVSLAPWVWESYGNKRLVDVVDKKLGTNFDIKKIECLMIVGLWCAHPARNLRPSIRQAIQGLNFELPLPNLPIKMPVPNYDVPSSSSSTPPAPTAMSGEPSLSLTL
ncbi:hypothetical protein Ddye_011553 [Dipteronia dyeriana]|uniref:SCP domain-containing protein n=1 Tax=Dipteronia dyeriana TaxID=168575 RepID=A0AAD9X2S1_9ROSI|nr:hypothetical protein Ddye_011553 [Dipteronia dyeriana]